MKSIRRVSVFAAMVIPLGLLAACGMAPKAEAPHAGEAAPAADASPTSAPAEEKEPATLADAEALLEKARADLDRLALNEPGLPGTAAGAAAPAPPSVPAPTTAAPAPAPRDEGRRADKSAASSSEAERPQAKEVNTCETACKAFSSLSRASDAVCRLDADGGKRCERARQIQQDASHRVASCGCSK
jgi:hypothetical protein